MESIHETVFEKAIAIEARSLSFYRAVSVKAKDENLRRVFELLAKEEAEHLELFCSLYPWDEDKLANLVGRNYSCTDTRYFSLLNTVDSGESEIEALKIALKEEQVCIDCYTEFMETIQEPHIHDVFARILDKTYKHLEMISEEYMRLTGKLEVAAEGQHLQADCCPDPV